MQPRDAAPHTMADDDNLSIYDEIEIEDMTFDAAQQLYHYPCPCGDRFQIALDDLRDEQDIAVCPSCSLMIRVIFDLVSTPWPRRREAADGRVASGRPAPAAAAAERRGQQDCRRRLRRSAERAPMGSMTAQANRCSHETQRRCCVAALSWPVPIS